MYTCLHTQKVNVYLILIVVKGGSSGIGLISWIGYIKVKELILLCSNICNNITLRLNPKILKEIRKHRKFLWLSNICYNEYRS